jgi:dihydropteroate synthase
VVARMNGATLFSVHDVAAVREALDVADAVFSHAPRPTHDAPHG